MKLHLQISAVTTDLLLLLTTFHPVHSSLKSDSRALLDFSNVVPHIRNLNWDQKTDICTSWIGITCTKDKTRVHGIRLPGFGFFGSIPPNIIGQLDALRVLSLRSNYLNGTLPKDILSIPSLRLIFLQHNNFSGDLPLSLSPRLSVIDLSFNSFSGVIPPEFRNLMRLSVFNLQFNFFYGNIPDFDLPRLKGLNLSHNSLNGSVPNSLQMFPVSSFLGNDRLCGRPMGSCSTILTPERSSFDLRNLSLRALVAIAIAGASFTILIFLILFFCLKRKRTTLIIANGSSNRKTENPKYDDFVSGMQGAEKNNKLVFFEGCSSSFDLEDLLRASAEVLGKGSCGRAYKAILDNSTTVVVKRLKNVGKKEFEHQMEIANEIGQHNNVVPLLAYHSSKDEKLLVYEYMANGSLSAALHGDGQTRLDWESRLRIAAGAARGLSHIHSGDGGKFIHGNIKSSNVFLNDGCVSDFGLSPMMSFLPDPGYRAPEVVEARKVNQKSDVYSFGVLLLEILTGKFPVRCLGYGDAAVDLTEWVQSVVREEWTGEVFDDELMKRDDGAEEEMVQMLRVALSCVEMVGDARPRMDEVVRMIGDIRGESGESNWWTGSTSSSPLGF